MKVWRFILSFFFFLAISLFGQIAEGHFKFLGCIIKSGTSVPNNFDLYWNQVTPENAGKWGSVEGTRDQYRWADLDRAYNYAKQKGFPFRFHVLVWGKQQPSWITSLDSAMQAAEVEEWIRLAGERYPEADYVEAVNEPIQWPPYDYYPSYYKALGGEGETGWDWVIWVFEKAREYFPYSKLLINEYNIFGGAKSINTYLKIINLLKERNLIDGICEQGHFLENVSPQTIKTRLDQLAQTGLPIQISEFDLNIADDAQQLAKYQQIFPVLWEHPAVEGITLWGYMEGQLWRTDAYLVRSDGTERPALQWLKDYVKRTMGIKFSSFPPVVFSLFQNYPNPFNESTRIEFQLNQSGDVFLDICDLNGEEIVVLEQGLKNCGLYSVSWNGEDNRGNPVASGVYLVRLKVRGSFGIFKDTRKITLLK